MSFNYVMELGIGFGYYGEDCFFGGDVIIWLCDVDFFVLNVYLFGINVKYVVKNLFFDNKFLF